MSERIGAGLAEIEAALDLEEERRRLRRAETWIFLRSLVVLAVVIIAVIVRSIVL